MSDFEINHDLDFSQKLNKRDLAIKYLGFINDADEILNRNQSKQALDYLLDLFLHENERTDTLFAMTDANQVLIINTLVDLIKTELKSYLNDVKNFDFTDSEQTSRINQTSLLLSRLIETLELLAKNSNQFCLKFHEISKLKDLYEIIQTIQLEYTESEIKTAKTQIKKLALFILHLSRFAYAYKTQWNECNSLLNSFQKKFSPFYDYVNWYVFLIQENLSTEINSFEQALKYNISFEIDNNESKEDKIKKCILGFKYLKFLNSPEKITISEQSMNILYYVYECEYFYYDDMNASFQTDLIEIFVNLIIYFYDEINENIKSNLETQSKQTDIKIKKNLVIIEKVTVIIQYYSNVSFKFCLDFNKTTNAIKYLFKFIQSDLLSDYLVENLTKKVSSFILKQLFDGILGCLHNLSQVYLSFQKLWEKECDSVNSLIQFSDKLGAINERYRWYVYMIVANIATDKQIDSLSEIKVALINIILFVKNCADSIESGEEKRIRVQLEENEHMEEITITNADEELTFHLVELFKALYHLAVNDNIKQVIYEESSMISNLKKIIVKGNEVEKDYALKLMQQLCFNEDVAKKLSGDLIEYFKVLGEDPNIKRKNIKKTIDGIMFLITRGDDKETKLATNETTTSSSNKQKHIMISYNRDSRDLCLTIKKQLEKYNFKIWIDVEDIHGSSLESMANAIEESMAVLMCILYI